MATPILQNRHKNRDGELMKDHINRQKVIEINQNEQRIIDLKAK